MESTDDAADVVGPFRLAFDDGLRDIEDGDFFAESGADADFRGVIGAAGDDDVAIDGEWHDEAITIIDVFSDEVHAPGGGGGDGCLGLKAVEESCSGV